MKLYSILLAFGLIFSVPMFQNDKDVKMEQELMSSRQEIYELRHEMQTMRNTIDSLNKDVSSIFVFPIKDTRIELTSSKGWRKDPQSGETRFHAGSDFVSYVDTAQIIAPQNGTVVQAGWISNTAGNGIWLDIGENKQLRFYHMSKLNVKPGDVVKQGDVIGNMGNSGKSTGPHLHFEMWEYDEAGLKLLDVENVKYRHPLLSS